MAIDDEETLLGLVHLLTIQVEYGSLLNIGSDVADSVSNRELHNVNQVKSHACASTLCHRDGSLSLECKLFRGQFLNVYNGTVQVSNLFATSLENPVAVGSLA